MNTPIRAAGGALLPAALRAPRECALPLLSRASASRPRRSPVRRLQPTRRARPSSSAATPGWPPRRASTSSSAASTRSPSRFSFWRRPRPWRPWSGPGSTRPPSCEKAPGAAKFDRASAPPGARRRAPLVFVIKDPPPGGGARRRARADLASVGAPSGKSFSTELASAELAQFELLAVGRAFARRRGSRVSQRRGSGPPHRAHFRTTTHLEATDLADERTKRPWPSSAPAAPPRAAGHAVAFGRIDAGNSEACTRCSNCWTWPTRDPRPGALRASAMARSQSCAASRTKQLSGRRHAGIREALPQCGQTASSSSKIRRSFWKSWRERLQTDVMTIR